MPNTIAIISDIHLQANNIELTNSFIKYIEQYAPRHQELYIIGDLFDAWIGDDVRSTYNSKIIKILRKLSNTTKIYFLPGNRDFLIGKQFSREAGCEIIPNIASINAFNKNIVLTHGDLLLTSDKKYLRMRKIFDNKIYQKIWLNLPVKTRVKIAELKRKKSTDLTIKKQDNTLKVDNTYLAELVKLHKADFFIYGHIHKTSISYLNSCVSISLPDWQPDSGSVELVISETTGPNLIYNNA